MREKRGEPPAKRGTRAGSPAVLWIVLALLLLPTLTALQDVEVRISLSSSEALPDENITVTVQTFISGVLVISIPTTVQVTDPRGNAYDLPMSNVGGRTQGSFSSDEEGDYTVTAASTIDGIHYSASERLIIATPRVDIDLRADPIVIRGGQANVTGYIRTEPEVTPVMLDIEAPGMGRFGLCELYCSNCTFSCPVQGLTETGDATIFAILEYRELRFTKNSSLTVSRPFSDRLNIDFAHANSLEINEGIEINATLRINGSIIPSPPISMSVIDPLGDEFELLPTMAMDGMHVVAHFYADTEGTYTVKAEALYLEEYTSAESSFIVKVTGGTVTLEDNRTEIATDTSDGRLWSLHAFRPDTRGNQTIIEISELSYPVMPYEAKAIVGDAVVPLEYDELTDTLTFRTAMSELSYATDEVWLEMPLNSSANITPANGTRNSSMWSIKTAISDTLCRSEFLLNEGEYVADAVTDRNKEPIVLAAEPHKAVIYHRCSEAKAWIAKGESFDFGDGVAVEGGFIWDAEFMPAPTPFNALITEDYPENHTPNITGSSFIEDGLILTTPIETRSGWMRHDSYLTTLREPVNGTINLTTNISSAKLTVLASPHIIFDSFTLYSETNSPALQGDSLRVVGAVSGTIASLTTQLWSPNSLLMEWDDNATINHSFRLTNASEPGVYLAVAVAEDIDGLVQVMTSGLLVRSANPSVSIVPNRSSLALRNTIVDYAHTITNTNYKEVDTIDLMFWSNYSTVLLYRTDGTQMRDTNRNGMVDTGLLRPGESVDITVKVTIPPDTPLGKSDFLFINASSERNPSAYSLAVDRTDIVSFLPEHVPKYVNDVGVSQLQLGNGYVDVRLRNLDERSERLEIGVSFDSPDSNSSGLSFYRTVNVFGNSTRIVSIDTPGLPTGSPLRLVAVIREEGGLPWTDENPDNDERVLLLNPDWYGERFLFRKAVPFKELLHSYHTNFTVRVPFDLPEYAHPESILIAVPEYEGNFSISEGRFKYLTAPPSGSDRDVTLLVELPDIEANIESEFYIYYSNVSLGLGPEEFGNEFIVRNSEAVKEGRWVSDRQIKGYHGSDYEHDLNLGKGLKSARFYPNVEADSFELYIWYPSYANFAREVPLLIAGMNEADLLKVNQQVGGGSWKYMGIYDFDETSYVEIQTYGTARPVVIDAFKFSKVSYYGRTEEEEMKPGLIYAAPPPVEIPVVENISVNVTLNMTLNITENLTALVTPLPDLTITEGFSAFLDMRDHFVGNLSYEGNCTVNVADATLIEMSIDASVVELVSIGGDGNITCIIMAHDLSGVTESNPFIISVVPAVEPVHITGQNISYKKIKNDPDYDAVIDSVIQEDGTLTVRFHHDSAEPLPISIEGSVTNYSLASDLSLGGETVVLEIPDWNDEYFRIYIGERTEIIEFGIRREYNLRIGISDASGSAVAATVEFIDADSKLVEKTGISSAKMAGDGKSSGLNVKEGRYDIRVMFSESPIKEIVINDTVVGSDSVSFIRVDDVDEIENGLTQYVEVFAIDPTGINFTTATATLTARGRLLYKCKDWDFSSQSCPPVQRSCVGDTKDNRACTFYGGWKKVALLTPGEEYSFTFNSTDPAYAEYNATLGAPRCKTSKSPCTAKSSLLRSIDSVGTPEPNQPNTVDACTDGGSGTYQDDESAENISIGSLGGSTFSPGDTVQVNATFYCWNGANDNLNFVYSNSSTSPSWTVKAFTDPCPASGFQTVSKQFTLDNNAGEHVIRVIIQYNGNTGTTCGAGNYDDNDDLAFQVAEIVWDQSSLDLGSGIKSGGNLSGSANVTSGGVNNNVKIVCDTGNCSTISEYWPDTTDMTDGQSSAVSFTCSNSTLGSFWAVFNVTSDDDTRPDQINVSCSITSPTVEWNQSTLMLSGFQSDGNATGSANITSIGASNNVVVSCHSGNCSQISEYWPDTTDMTNGQSSAVNFTCSNSTTGSFSALFNVTSDEDSVPDQINVSCSIATVVHTAAQIYDTTYGQNGDTTTVSFNLQNETILGNLYTHTINANLTIEESGWYKVSYGATWRSTGANNRHTMKNWIVKNGAAVVPSETRCYIRNTASGGNTCSNAAVLLVSASVGDNISLLGTKDHGTAGATSTVSDAWLYAQKVDRRVALIYDTDGGENINDSAMVIGMDSDVKLDSGFIHTGNATRIMNPGWYKIYFTVNTDLVGNSDRRIVRSWLRKNGNTNITPSLVYGYIREENNGDQNHQSGYTLVNLSVGDYVEVMADLESKDGTGAHDTMANMSWMLMEKIKTDDIFQTHEEGGAQQIAEGAEDAIDFDTDDVVGSSYTHSQENNITFAKAGWYEIGYAFGWDDANAGARHIVSSFLRKNGIVVHPSNQSGYSRGTSDSLGNGRYMSNAGNLILSVDAGDFIQLRVTPVGGYANTTPNAAWLNIIPVGVGNVAEVSWNQTATVSIGTVEIGVTAYSNATVTSFGNNTNVQVTELSGNGTSITSANPASIGSMNDMDNQSVQFNCTPIIGTKGYYETVFEVSSAEDPTGETITVSCMVPNSAPIAENLTINSTSGYNTTGDNLTADYDAYDPNADAFTNITNWYLNGTSFTVLYLPFEGGSNSTFTKDYSGYSDNGTVNGATWNSAGGHDGHGAYDYDGTNDYITTSLPTVFNSISSNDFSISLWANISDVTGYGTYTRLMEARYDNNNFVQFNIHSSGNVEFVVEDVTTQRSKELTSTISANELHHYVGVWHAATNTLEYYLDGVLQPNAGATNSGPGNVQQLRIGERTNGAGDYTGSIDEFQVYDRTLSSGQVQALYQKRTDIIVSDETNKFDRWQVCITPNDGVVDGNETCSSNLTIRVVVASTAPANGTVIDRDSISSDPDVINLSAYAYGEQGISVYYYANLTDPAVSGQSNIYLGSNTTDSNSQTTLYFDPNGTHYAGNYTWWVNTTNGTTLNRMNFVIKGGLNTTFEHSTYHPNPEYNKTQSIRTNATLQSLGPETEDDLNTSYNAAVNATLTPPSASVKTVSLSYSGNEWNYTYSISTDEEIGNWTVKFNSTADYFYRNLSDSRNTTLYSKMNLTDNTLTSGTVYAYEITSITCNVNDTYNDTLVTGATVYFYRNGSFMGTNNTDASGEASYTFSINKTGTYNITCNITTQLPLLHYKGPISELNSTLTVIPFPITPQTPSNGTQVDRDELSPTIPDTIVLNVSVPPEIPDGITISFYGNLTDPLTPGPSLLGSNSTSSGIAYLIYNPDVTTYAGNYTWYATANSGNKNGTRTFIEYGSMNVSFNSTSYYPNSTYDKPVNTTFYSILSSYGPETKSDLNTSYNAAVNITLIKSDLTKAYRDFGYNGSLWNASYELDLPEPRGYWNASLNGSADYMYTATLDSRLFYVNNIPPTHTTPVLNSTSGTNYTDENLTVYNQSTNDYEGDTVKNIINWDKSGSTWAEINMPFEGGSNSTWTRDYSGNEKNSTVVGASWNATSGWDGFGAYRFSGGEWINTSVDLMQWLGGSASVSVWINTTVVGSDTSWTAPGITGIEQNGGGDDIFWGFIDSAGRLRFSAGNGAHAISTVAVNDGLWHHIVLVRNHSNGRIWIYLDGGLDNTTISASGTMTTSFYSIGRIGDTGGTPEYFDGWIDDFMVFDSMLTPEQITILFENRTDRIASEETDVNDVWQACVTPNDGWDDGTTLCSNTLRVIGKVESQSPTNGTVIDRDSISSDPDSIGLVGYNYGDPSVTLYFYANLSDPVVGGQTDIFLGSNTTNSSGHTTVYFNPDMTYYAGNYTWWVNATNSTTLNKMDFIIKGGLNTTFQDATYHPNPEYNKTQTIRLNATLQTRGPETEPQIDSLYNAGINATLSPSTAAVKTVALAYSGNEWTGTYATNVNEQLGNWTVKYNSTADYFYRNLSDSRNTTLYSKMNLTDNTLASGTVYAYEITSITCKVNDTYNDTPVTGAAVYFYRNGSFMGTNNTDASGEASYTFQMNTTGTYNITCNITTQLPLLHYKGPISELNSTLTVIPFPITPQTPSNGTQVDRDELSPTIPDTIVLNVSVPPEIPDGITISFYSNLTDPLTGGASLLGSNTTSSGNAILYYNPPTATYAGNHTWWANATAGDPNGTKIYTEIGSLQLTLTNNSDYPRATYNQNGTLTSRYNLTSPGPETRDQLNASYTAGVNATVRSSNGAATYAHTYINPYWQGQYSIITLAGVGIWNITGNTSATYFLRDTSTAKNFTVYGFMNVSDIGLSDNPVYAYQNDVVTCNVSDQHTSAVVSGANVTFYRNGTYLGYNTTNSSGSASYVFQTNVTGSYSVICNITDELDIYYYAGDAPELNIALQVDPFPIQMNGPANGTRVDRDSVDSTVNDILILNVSIPSYVPSGVPIIFYANLTDPTIGGQTDLALGTNTTDGSGIAILYYNPNSTGYAGSYTWWGWNDNGIGNGTRTYHEYGGLNTTFYSATDYPNSSYMQNDSIDVRGLLQSLAVESESQLNSSYLAKINATFYLTNGVKDFVMLVYNTSYWNRSYQISYTAPVGAWNISLNSTADYFFKNSTKRSFTVTGYSFLDLWENNGTKNGTLYITCDTDIYFYANFTDTSNDSITGATCTIDFSDRSKIMAYNASSEIYQYNRTYTDRDNYTYNVTCNKTYYLNSTESENIFVTSSFNIFIEKNFTSRTDDSYRVAIHVENRRDCPENSIEAYDLLPTGYVAYNHSLDVTNSSLVTGLYPGNATSWLFNLTNMEKLTIKYILNASGDYGLQDAHIVGVDPR